MTEILKAHNDADFLAMVPAAIGYHAENSLVCVAFSGKRTCGGFRVNLPTRRRASDYRLIANAVIGILSRIPHADRVAPVIYTDATFKDESGVPWVDLARSLVARLESQGFGITSALCVASDGWANYFDPDYPREGRPLSDISNSPLQAEPTVRDVPELAQWSTLPDVTPDEVDEFEDEIEAVEEGERACELLSFAAMGLSEFVEVVAVSPDDLSLTAEALLLLASQAPANRDVITLQIAFGQLVGEAVLSDNERLHDIQHRTGQSMDEVVLTEVEEGRLDLKDGLSNLMMGEGTMRPDVERVKIGINRLKRMIALAPPEFQPAPLCMLAWLLWSRGLGSAAGHFVDRALNIDPNYGMAQVLFALFASGRLPEWGFTNEPAPE